VPNRSYILSCDDEDLTYSQASENAKILNDPVVLDSCTVLTVPSAQLSAVYCSHSLPLHIYALSLDRLNVVCSGGVAVQMIDV
jgi:hypothetical protein